MSSNANDPLDWTVDEVVNFLCHNPQTPWSHSSSRVPRPDPTSFEVSLRENFVTGEILLRDVDKNALRDDLGLRALGHRSCIMLAIRYLQLQSLKFQQSIAHNPSLTSPSPVPRPSQTQDTTPRPSPVQRTSPVLPDGFRGMESTAAALISSPHRPPIIPTIADSLSRDATENARNIDQDESQAGPDTFAHDPASKKLEFGGARPQEHIVIDSLGRKRRRLDLTFSAEPRSHELSTEKSEKTSTSKDWYMGPDVLTPGRVFYSSQQGEEDEQTFTMICRKLPTAQRLFVKRRLDYFFRQPPIQLPPSEGNYQQAVVPYNPSIVKSSSDRFFTLYAVKEGGVRVTKERVDDWPQLKLQYEANGEASIYDDAIKPSDPFSCLLQKYPVQEDLGDAYPLYGDSGSDGEFDEQTLEEMEEERNELRPSRQVKLGPVEMESILQECISCYEKDWRQTRMPKEEYKARNIWLAARRGNCVNQEIKALTKDISLLESRLQKLKDELRKTAFSTEAELRTQCQCLEYTVFQIQKQLWRVSILGWEICPPKVPAPPKPQPKTRRHSGDEESLDSESDYISSGSLDDFIVDDIDNHQVPHIQSHASSSSSDGDDDIISVSGTRRRTRKRVPIVLASRSASPPNTVWETSDVIDLTVETPEPDDLRIETPPLNPVEMAKPKIPSGRVGESMSPPPALGSPGYNTQVKTENTSRSLPKLSDMDEIMLLDWELIEERQDRGRLLAKLIGCLSDEERRRLGEYIPEYQFSALKRLTRRALNSLSRGSSTVPGMKPIESSVIMRTASFYISWVRCVHLGLVGIRQKFVTKALKDLDGGGFGTYYDALIKRLKRSQTWIQKREPVDSVDESEPSHTPHKKRKREVKESQAAKMTQASAQLRVAQQEEQRKKLERRLERTGISNDNPSHQAISFKDPAIYLDPHIGLRVKSHQLNGIRFMWRELVEDKDQQGCLLAHTMGLGKTMQVISLLTTISQAATSNDPEIRKQIPEAFRRSQTLILCPSSLIENWHEEFLMWSPENSPIGLVRRVSANDALSVRLKEVSDWDQEGGVLLISYNIFRSWIINNATGKRPPPLSDAQHESVRKWLLDGPNIIVADEAHKMKNPSSAISVAAMQFRSKSRVALTGSPLANNLGDYYTMVNWIADGYLGSLVQFKALYIEPIEQGLFVDSTYTERRKSLVKLQVLKRILEPKINRADITVLEGDLPPKVEFVLTVPLTNLQREVYDSYAGFVLQGRTDDVGQAQLWSWLAVIGLCCNHPACFREKLLSRANDAARRMGDAEQIETVPGDEPITQVGLPDLATLVARQEQLFAKVPDIKAVELSARAEIMNHIVDESIGAGDKVLIFSQSLPTLNYIEHVMKASNRNYSRLDGQTPIAGRQAATKQFNQGDQQQVYLISTRAGGLGLNIPGANRVIIFDFSFSPVWEEQAVGRAYRLGQQKPVFVYRFIAGGTFEEIIHHKAIFKTQLSVRVVDKKNPVRFAQKKPGDYLFPAKPVRQEDTSEFIGKDPLVLDKILQVDMHKEERLIRGITLTQTFHKEDNDKLTEEEKKSVQEEYDDENLKRTDPEAYYKKIAHKQFQQMQMQNQRPYHSHPPFPNSVAHGAHPPPHIPQSAHNFGPPALGPDMIMYKPPLNVDTNSAARPSFLAHAQAPLPAYAPNILAPHVNTAAVSEQRAGPAGEQMPPSEPGGLET
ncbi:putative SNF2 family helicase/ATPase [Aspergillus lucknowensis]|uniref:P-loop containing nucleoside triphosphate hydrolase protein n=1 Tax=Aspergillus lucknowensis TaxID=176173 RepID=A0ABR4LM86_9EURO